MRPDRIGGNLPRGRASGGQKGDRRRADPQPALRPLFLYRKPSGRYLLTDDTACDMLGAQVMQLGYLFPDPQCNSTPLYRLLHSGNDDHFYTHSATERDSAIALGYTSEGIVGHVWRNP